MIPEEPPASRPVRAQAIHAELDRFVIGQSTAKLGLSVLLSMHQSWFVQRNPLHKAPNALAIGPTGVGKTHSLRTAARFLGLPHVVIDASALVRSGIVGLQVEDIVQDLLASADAILSVEPSGRRLPSDAVALAERGIIFIDEFDKIRSDGTSSEGFGDVQRRLLKLAEGARVGVGQRRHLGDSSHETLDTSGILMIASGVFDGIKSSKLRSRRPHHIERVLRATDDIISVDIVNFGFIPELVARFPIVIEYHQLEPADLLEILNNPEVSPAHVWISHFAHMEKELIITDEARIAIAKQAAELRMGARGLQQVLFPVLAQVAYDFETSDVRRFELTAERVSVGRRSAQ